MLPNNYSQTLTLTALEISWLKIAIEMNPSSNPTQQQVYEKILERMSHPSETGYSLHTHVGTHPECWFFTTVQGPQTFTLKAETYLEKQNFIRKLHCLRKSIEDTLITLESQQND